MLEERLILVIGDGVSYQFRHDVKFESETTWTTKKKVLEEYGSVQNLVDSLTPQFLSNIEPMIIQAFAEKGIEVSVVEVRSVEGVAREETPHPYLGYDVVYFKIIADVTLDSNTEFIGSPIAPLVIIAIGLAIALIIAAITVPPAFFDWLKSMTVKTTTIKKYVYDPITGKYELVSEETYTQPSMEGIIAVAVGIGIIFFCALGGYILYREIRAR